MHSCKAPLEAPSLSLSPRPQPPFPTAKGACGCCLRRVSSQRLPCCRKLPHDSIRAIMPPVVLSLSPPDLPDTDTDGVVALDVTEGATAGVTATCNSRHEVMSRS